MKDTTWMDSAACRGGHREWVFDRHPGQRAMDRLVGICACCPVRVACAAHALDQRSSSGVWAGIWVPSTSRPNGRKDKRYLAARRRLAALLTESMAS